MLRQRVLVAVVGLPIGVAAIILGGYYLFGVAIVLSLLGLHEYYTLLRPYRPNLLVGYLAGLGVLAGSFFLGTQGMLGALAGLLILTFFWSLFGELGAHLVGRMAMTAFGVVWIPLGFAYVLLLRDLEHGMALTILLFACTILSDTLAYFVGSAVGRHKMAPHISPKKSVEGAVGGLVGAVVAALIVRIYSPWLPTREAIILGLIIGLVGQWGDLFESAFKRDFRVKDSGRLLPGHGGILDRFDSMLFAGFSAYWAALLLLGDLVR
ncbi:MAG: phosphatidate cytidylyltransferase [Actinomycetia bacterium]|nr:phosphatidate cytidylyltransferase [Actinomycetes bacterium]